AALCGRAAAARKRRRARRRAGALNLKKEKNDDMEYRQLGGTDLRVSLICLGTMTFGEQNTEEEGHAQMDYAVDQGVNFFDTAELYAIPPRAETYGRTEEIIG